MIVNSSDFTWFDILSTLVQLYKQAIKQRVFTRNIFFILKRLLFQIGYNFKHTLIFLQIWYLQILGFLVLTHTWASQNFY